MSKIVKSLSIFFPALNDVQVLPSLIRKAYRTAKQITPDFEIIIVDDGSKDNTYNMLLKAKKRYRQLKIVRHSKNLGYGTALISGFNHAKKEWVFYTDGDGQYDPNELMKLVEKVNNSVDVVNGCKLSRSDSVVRKKIGNIYNRALHAMYSLPISDIDCDFRLIKRSFLRKVSLKSSSGIICLELILKLKKAGARFAEVNVHHYKRTVGRSEFFNVKNIFKTLIDHVAFYILEK